MALSAGLAADVQGVVDRLRALWVYSTTCYGDPTGCAIPEILFFPFSENAGTLFRSVARLEAIDAAFLALLAEPMLVRLAATLKVDLLCWLLEETGKAERVLPRRDNVRDNDLWLNDLSDLIGRLELFGADEWCVAPCACPCASWPPKSWPCGGLNETYAIDNGLTSPYDASAIFWRMTSGADWTEYRLSSPVIVAAHDSVSCLWVGDGQVEIRAFVGGVLYDWTALPNTWTFTMTLNTVAPCFWGISASFDAPGTKPPGAVKDVGMTPVGAFLSGDNACGYTVT